MYTVTIYDTSMKKFKSYSSIHTIKYFDNIIESDWITVTGDDILTHHFPFNCNYQLLADNGNYSISSSIIGSFEIQKN